jgi:hypothetical protein
MASLSMRQAMEGFQPIDGQQSMAFFDWMDVEIPLKSTLMIHTPSR